MTDLTDAAPVREDGAPALERADDAPRKAARRRRAPRPASRVPRVRLLAIVALLIVAAGTPFWAPLLLRRLAFFHVRRIEIVGARFVAPSDILSRLHVDTLASVWDPTAPLVRRVMSQTEVRSVAIRRKLPGTLVLEITERVPVALVPTAQGFRPYDDRGVALPIDPSRVVVDAPIVIVRDSVVFHLLGDLRQENLPLYQRVSEVRRIGADELVLQLVPSLPVRAMKDVTAQRLGDIEPVESDLVRRQAQVAELDLRYRDQVIARVR